MSKKFLFSFLLTAFVMGLGISAQAQDVNEYYSKAKRFINKGRNDSATFYLAKALELAPGNLEILEDLLYVQYLDRDFVKATSLAENLIKRTDAGVKTFQLAGLTYKDIADYKAAKQVYEKGLAKFPTSGLLYSEFGDLYSQMNKGSEAIRLWEKGIEVDPGYNNNYYFASKYYYEKKNWIWMMLYGETFVNIESLSDRTREIKELLAIVFASAPTPGFLGSKPNGFAQAVIGTLSKTPVADPKKMDPQTLTLYRMNFINEWKKENAGKYPFRLFEYQDQLIKEGLFEAYNQWLFASFDYEGYEKWKAANKEKQAAYEKFTGNRVYKVPAGQYYQGK